MGVARVHIFSLPPTKNQMGAQASKQAVRRLPKQVRRDPAAIHDYPTETPSSLRESAAGRIPEFPW